jgi:hypothetical protein
VGSGAAAGSALAVGGHGEWGKRGRWRLEAVAVIGDWRRQLEVERST